MKNFSDNVRKFMKCDEDEEWCGITHFSYVDTRRNTSISFEEMKNVILNF